MSLVMASLMVTALAVVPLSEAQRMQVGQAIDGSVELDEGALYPLLDNVLQWSPEGTPEASDDDISPADYDALLAHPADHRGEAVVIEGRLARAREFGLVRPGAWGDALTEWVLLVRDDPDEVAVVYFVAPAGTPAMPPPPMGTPVRTVARFYKLWRDQDRTGAPTTYLTFVGRSAEVAAPAPGSAVPTDGRAWVLIPPLVLLFAAYALVRFLLRPRRTRPAPLRPHPTPSPEETAAALEALDQRRDTS